MNFLGDWVNVIDPNEFKEVTTKLDRLYTKGNITPTPDEVFRAFTLCDYNSLQVVMIGQDPYPQRGVATGLAFANKDGMVTTSPSLRVLMNAVVELDKPHYGVRFDTTLESWAKQGVLLLNTSLTTEVGNPGSHSLMWKPFIQSFIKNLGRAKTGIVYMLFGKEAQSLLPFIGVYNNVLVEQHPTYYAREGKEMSSDIFKVADECLISKYGKTIKWYEEYEVL